jgi:hypothetical protein
VHENIFFFLDYIKEGREGLPYGYRVSQVAQKKKKERKSRENEEKESYTEGEV